MSDTKDEQIEIISVPPSTFEFGDKRLRVLYGPELPPPTSGGSGGRNPIGFIDEEQVSRLEAMLEYADANMPKDTV